METKPEIKKCPDCGETMEPQATVATTRHYSRWWRCSNGRCRAQWLLPMFSAEPKEDEQWTF